MKVLDESGNLFHFVGVATYVATVTDPRGAFQGLMQTPEEVFALYTEVTKVRGGNKTAYVAKKIRLTDEKSFDDLVRRFSAVKSSAAGVSRTLTSFMRGKLLSDSA